MRPAPLHSITAPSPAVLSFLRKHSSYAFEGHQAHGTLTRCQGALTAAKSRGRRQEYKRCLGDGATAQEVRQRGCRTLVSSGKLAKGPVALQTQSLPWASSRVFKGPSTPSHCHQRDFSTNSLALRWDSFWSRKRTSPKLPSPGPSSPLSSFLDDNGNGLGGLGRVARPGNELKLRCTELDENGNVTMTSGEFKKSELIAKYGLLPRDLRKIDSSLLPHILVRPSAILINLLHLRVLIKHNRVLVFDAYGTTNSYSQSVFMYDLDSKLRQKESVANGTLAYEFRALEAVLISVTLGLESEFEGVSDPVVKVLRDLEEDIDRDKLRYLLIYSKKLGTFEQKARLVRDSLTELLEADDDLSAMYLSEKAQGKTRSENDHTEVEMLLESYHKVADEIVQAAENLVSSIRSTEEIVKAILDANRNALMLLELKFSIYTLSIGAGTFIAALYGMNLKNFLEESDYGFFGISAGCVFLGAMAFVWSMLKLRRVRRVSMYGHSSSKNSGWGLGAWGGRSLRDPYADSLGERRMKKLRQGGVGPEVIAERERQVARRLAEAEKRNDEVLKS